MKKRNIYFFENSLSARLFNTLRFLNSFLRYKLSKKIPLDPKSIRILTDLNNDGIAILPNFISPEILKELNKENDKILSDFKFNFPVMSHSMVSKDIEDKFFNDNKTVSYKDIESQDVFVRDSGGLDYLTFIKKYSPHILKVTLDKYSENFSKLFLDEYLLNIVTHYLGCIPGLNEAYLRRSFPAKHAYQNNNWHRDTNDKYKLVKVFFLLSNMTPDNGPFTYLKNTCSDYSFLNGKMYYSNDEIESELPDFKLRCIPDTLPAGTVIIADTRGLHKAGLPEKRYRDMGFAVFTPRAPFVHYSGYSIKKSIFDKLTHFQKKFIQNENIVDDDVEMNYKNSF